LGNDRHQNNIISANIRNNQLLAALDVPSDTDSDCDSNEEYNVCGAQVVTNELTLFIGLRKVLLH